MLEGGQYLIMDIRVPAVLQVLFNDVHAALTGCVHEFDRVSWLHLSTQTNTAKDPLPIAIAICDITKGFISSHVFSCCVTHYVYTVRLAW